MTFVPTWNTITAVALGQETTVTLQNPVNYDLGEYISFRVPRAFGTYELNNLRGLVIDISGQDVTVDIDSSDWTPFIYPVSSDVSPAITVPAGSGIIPGSTPSTMLLADAFDQIPP